MIQFVIIYIYHYYFDLYISCVIHSSIYLFILFFKVFFSSNSILVTYIGMILYVTQTFFHHHDKGAQPTRFGPHINQLHSYSNFSKQDSN